MVETIRWTDEGVVMIDQTRLPLEQEYVTCRSYEEVAQAIRTMVIRGAPAIGVAAAMGVALGVLHADEKNLDAEFSAICDTLAGTRPTAVNLFWAIERMRGVYASVRGQPGGRDSRASDRRGEADPRRRHRDQSGHRPPRCGAGPGSRDGIDALQCRSACDRRIRHGARRYPGRMAPGSRWMCSPMRLARFSRARG